MILQDLGLKYRTDKAVQGIATITANRSSNISYCEIYEKHFSKNRLNVERLLEIGTLTGASARMWKEYFPNAEINVVDINPYTKSYEEDRIKIHIGDQNDELFLMDLSQKLGPLDIIIDDGSHITEHQIKTFKFLYPNLKDNGFYVIEDLLNSYEEALHPDVRSVWPGMHYNKESDPLKNFRVDFNQFINDQIRSLDQRLNEKLFSIHFYYQILMIENYNEWDIKKSTKFL